MNNRVWLIAAAGLVVLAFVVVLRIRRWWRWWYDKHDRIRITYSAFGRTQRADLKPGDSLVVTGVYTLRVLTRGWIWIGPPLTDEQLDEIASRNIEARYGVKWSKMTQPDIDNEEWRSAVEAMPEAERAMYDDPQTYFDTHHPRGTDDDGDHSQSCCGSR